MDSSFKLASIFTDHMVLQRDSVNPVWGNAEDGKEIKVEFLDKTYKTIASGGKWSVSLSPAAAGGPYEMVISCDNCVYKLKDILIGEVWVAGGQSNMQWPLSDSIGGREEAAKADCNEIRYYDVPRVSTEEESLKEGQNAHWVLCKPETAGNFSAVAYYFAKSLHASLGIPIGIIGCNMGATSASCWISEEYLASDEELRVYLDEYYECINNQTDEEYYAKLEEFNKKFEKWQKKADEYKALHPNAGESEIARYAGALPWPPPMGKTCFMRPCALYNYMVRTIVPYGIRGVIFYQGESDTDKPHLYGKLFKKLMENWRNDWKNPALPFIFTQLAYYGNGEKPEEDTETEGIEWAIVREQQLLVSKSDPNTAMAVITDCGEKDNIHPGNKKTVGERLALLAKARIYGLDVVCEGPVLKDMKVQGKKVILTFDNTAGGLTARDGKLTGFKLCGPDGKFVNAEAVIKGDTVELFAPGISMPVAVRYGFANYAHAGLMNGEGLPASPFRTDNFDLKKL